MLIKGFIVFMRMHNKTPDVQALAAPQQYSRGTAKACTPEELSDVQALAAPHKNQKDYFALQLTTHKPKKPLPVYYIPYQRQHRPLHKKTHFKQSNRDKNTSIQN